MRVVIKRWVLPPLIVVLGLVAARAMIASRSDLPRTARAIMPTAVQSQRVVISDQPAILYSQGEARPRRSISLISEVAGRVIKVSEQFLDGARVELNAEILRIDPIDYEVALANAEAAIAAAKLSLAEVKVLKKHAAIAEAEARVHAAQEQYRKAEADLANTVIRAPFAAVIANRDADIGQYVQPGKTLMTLLGTAVMEVRLPILPADLPFVEYGQRDDGSWPRVTLSAQYGNTQVQWQGRLVRLEDRVDTLTRSYFVVAEVDQPYDTARHPMPLTTGSFVSAEIEGKMLPATVRLPRQALHGDQNVFVSEQGRLVSRQVRIARTENDSVLISDGLLSGEEVILSRLDLMVEGMPVSTGSASP